MSISSLTEASPWMLNSNMLQDDLLGSLSLGGDVGGQNAVDKLRDAWGQAMAAQGLNIDGQSLDFSPTMAAQNSDSQWWQANEASASNQDPTAQAGSKAEGAAHSGAESSSKLMEQFMRLDGDSASNAPKNNFAQDFINNLLNPVTNQLIKPVSGARF